MEDDYAQFLIVLWGKKMSNSKRVTIMVLAVVLAFLIIGGNEMVEARGGNLPKPNPKFHGKIGKTFKDSKADSALFESTRAPKGAPNIL
jgi:hypothetical protein